MTGTLGRSTNWTRADRKERNKKTFYALFDINNEKSGEKKIVKLSRRQRHFGDL